MRRAEWHNLHDVLALIVVTSRTAMPRTLIMFPKQRCIFQCPRVTNTEQVIGDIPIPVTCLTLILWRLLGGLREVYL